MERKDKILLNWKEKVISNSFNSAKMWQLCNLHQIIIANIYECRSPITMNHNYSSLTLDRNPKNHSSLEEAMKYVESFLFEKGFKKLNEKLNHFI